MVHTDLWTPYIFKTESSNKYEKCGIICESLVENVDFFALQSGSCYCGSFSHSGTRFEVDQAEVQIHLKSEPTLKYLDEHWIELEEMDQWHQWIFLVNQQEEKTGHRECLFRGMHHPECDFVKYYHATKQCFLGSFFYTGVSKVASLDVSKITPLVFVKKGWYF